MYESHFRLTGKPFQLLPDPDFFFGSKGHKRATAYLDYGVSRGEGFIVITGEIGAGKTTLVRNLFRKLAFEKIAAYEAIALADCRIQGGKRFVAARRMKPKREARDLGRRRIDIHAVNVGLQNVADETRIVRGHKLACNRFLQFAHGVPSVEQIAQRRNQEGSRAACRVHDGSAIS